MKRLFCTWYVVLCSLYLSAQAKYVFYFIGDGMSANHVLAAELYRSAVNGKPLDRVPTLMTTFPYTGQVTTHSASSGITDSSAAGTCLATGTKTNNGIIGLDANGDTLRTIAERLKDQGWGIGITTTVAIDHATPASFYGHTSGRNNYYEIGQQLAKSRFDFFGGAGFHYPQGKDDNEPINLYRLAEDSGYTVARGYAEAQKIINHKSSITNHKLIMVQPCDTGMNHGECLPYVIDRRPGDLTLAQIVENAILFLNNRYERFFMMVEGGMIDYACHGDDAATAIGEVWDMDEALRLAYAFYLEHPDETLIVVTSDHDTGGLALGNSKYVLYLDLLQYQRCSSWILSDKFSALFANGNKPSWNEVKQLYRENLGLWDQVPVKEEEEAKLLKTYKQAVAKKSKDNETLYKTINSLSNAGIQLLDKKAKIGWTSWGHTGSTVPVFAIGVGAERFTGWHDNTEIVPLILQATAQ